MKNAAFWVMTPQLLLYYLECLCLWIVMLYPV